MISAPNILLVDDEPSVLRYTKTLLEIENYNVETAGSGEEALQRMNRGLAPNLIVLDMVMPGMDGLQTLENCKRLRPDQKVVMISCVNDTNKVVQAIKLGASDYVTKPFLSPQFQGAIRRALNPLALNARPTADAPVRGSELVDDLDNDFFFLAASPAMKQIRAQAALIAKVNVPVLLLGESGVGKEILARLIHKMSIRAHRPIVKVNCAALPADLLESELFGYEAGAFTGANKSKPGKFEMAHKGTILLDEIGEMSAALQAKLLHVLQDGTFSRLGGRVNVSVDARVLAATNIDVKKAIAEHKLREDLYYRLNAFTVTVPPLRERRDEIPILLRYYMNNLARQFGKNALPISDKLVHECMRYAWPGNLRELGNLVKRYLVLEDENQLVDELQSKSKDGSAQDGSSSSGHGGLKALVRSLKDDAEAREIQRALDDSNWNRKVAAGQLNISYKALLYKIKQHGLSPAGTRGLGLRAKAN
ncbi:MAG: sigma-54-dependent Fis family transcriptional regulator [Candidatus Angelobacter sp.]|nr:sigma-54-dependent Fis family transcriptional regulator [Candidatus Angelobacter sp.]